MKHFIFMFLLTCYATVAMEQDTRLVVSISDIKREQKITDSFVRHIVTKNIDFVQRYLKDKLSPLELDLCLQDASINVNRLLSKSPRYEWWEIALQAENIENFAVIASRLNKFTINRALGSAILQGKSKYVAVCLQNQHLIKPLNFDHNTEYGKKLIEKIVHDPSVQLARLVIPKTKSHFAIALLNKVFDLATTGLSPQYKEMIELCFMQANIADRLGPDGLEMISRLWNGYVQAKIGKIDLSLHKIDKSNSTLRRVSYADIYTQIKVFEQEKALWQELIFKD